MTINISQGRMINKREYQTKMERVDTRFITGKKITDWKSFDKACIEVHSGVPMVKLDIIILAVGG